MTRNNENSTRLFIKKNTGRLSEPFILSSLLGDAQLAWQIK